MSNYLNKILVEKIDNTSFPFSLPIFKNGLELDFDKPITFIIGNNGAGKSTFLESLAVNAGFNVLGGNKNHCYNNLENYDNLKLADNMKLYWRLKTSKGFFFRAESFFNFAGYLDELAIENGKEVFSAYGGKSLQKQSHGESFLSLFSNKFTEGLFILDEPETALSAERQLLLISLLNDLALRGKCQFIIATHSPLLITIPNSKIYEINENGKVEVKKHFETNQFELYRNFLNSPERYLKHLCDEKEI